MSRCVRRDEACWLCREGQRVRGSQQQLTMTWGTLRLRPSWARRAANLEEKKQKSYEA